MYSEKSIKIEGVIFDCKYQLDGEDVHFDSVKVGGNCIVEHLRPAFLDRLEVEVQAAIKADNEYAKYYVQSETLHR